MPQMSTTMLSGPDGEVPIGDGHPFRIIGERINPTGRTDLTEELKVLDMSPVKADACAQVEAGAAVLDINAGIPGVDEPAMLASAVAAVHEVVGVPLCIDSSTPEALEAAVPGPEARCWSTRSPARTSSLERLLPLVARFGAAVIGIANDDDGISMDPRSVWPRRARSYGGRRPRHRSHRRDHRSAHDADRRDPRRRDIDVRDHAVDP